MLLSWYSFNLIWLRLPKLVIIGNHDTRQRKYGLNWLYNTWSLVKKNASRLRLEAFFFIYYDQVLNNLYLYHCNYVFTTSNSTPPSKQTHTQTFFLAIFKHISRICAINSFDYFSFHQWTKIVWIYWEFSNFSNLGFWKCVGRGFLSGRRLFVCLFLESWLSDQAVSEKLFQFKFLSKHIPSSNLEIAKVIKTLIPQA